jgi:serine/threonine-protein phosphatase 2A activator
MASIPSTPLLERLPSNSQHTFITPSKRINDGDDLNFFNASLAYRDLVTWLFQLNRSIFPTKDSEGKVQQCRLDLPPPFSQEVQSLRNLISDLDSLIEKAPPDTGPRRFGNVAFRTWFNLVEEDLDRLLDQHLGSVLERFGEQRSALKEELKVYFLGGFGSAQRLDYGTGHELSFVAFLGCLWKLGAFGNGEERGIVVGVIQP